MSNALGFDSKTKELGINLLDSYLIHLSKQDESESLELPLEKLNQRSRNDNKSNINLLQNSNINESHGRKFGDDISDITNHQGQYQSFNKIEKNKKNLKSPKLKSLLYSLSSSDILQLCAFVALNLAVK